jgi:hypothetical protein
MAGQAGGIGGIGSILSGNQLGVWAKALNILGTAIYGEGGAIIYDYGATEARNTSASLQVKSTTGGFLINPMTASQRSMITPTDFLFCTQSDGTPGLYMYHPTLGWDRIVLASEL